MNMKYILGIAALACLVLLTMPVAALQPGQDFNGPHYNLNIIGVPKDKAADVPAWSNENRHTMFVPLERKTNIYMTQGDDFAVLDANGADGTARFQLAPGLYEVYAVALGKPNGNVMALQPVTNRRPPRSGAGRRIPPTLREASALPPDSKLKPGAPRGAAAPGAPPRDVSNDIWASDVHLTPDAKFLYAAEPTSSTIGASSVDAATGKLTYLSSTPVEKQPRSLRIHHNGKCMVVSGGLSETISVYAIEASGGLTLLQKSPTGKGSNWVEIVSFD